MSPLDTFQFLQSFPLNMPAEFEVDIMQEMELEAPALSHVRAHEYAMRSGDAPRVYKVLRQRRRPSTLEPLQIPNTSKSILPRQRKGLSTFHSQTPHPGDEVITESKFDNWTPPLSAIHNRSTFPPTPSPCMHDKHPANQSLLVSSSPHTYSSPISANDVYGWESVLDAKIEAEELAYDNQAMAETTTPQRVRTRKSLLHRVLHK